MQTQTYAAWIRNAGAYKLKSDVVWLQLKRGATLEDIEQALAKLYGRVEVRAWCDRAADWRDGWTRPGRAAQSVRVN
jgi:hypothetical protein